MGNGKPETGDVEVHYNPPGGNTNTGNTGSTGSTGSTSSGSSSSSSGSSAPADPLSGLNSIQRQKYSMLSSVYAGIWGETPDPDVIKHAIGEGLNVWQFAFQQRMDPAFLTTKTFKDGADSWASLLKQMGVAG